MYLAETLPSTQAIPSGLFRLFEGLGKGSKVFLLAKNRLAGPPWHRAEDLDQASFMKTPDVGIVIQSLHFLK